MRILLVEDDSDIAANISDFLTATGHVVDIAHDGADGLRLAREHAHDLFLLDVNLPVLSGFELCRVLRETLHIEAPVLFTTARSALPDKLAGFEAGGWDYLVKPFSLAELDARIRATQLRASTASTRRLGRSSFRPATRCLTIGNTDIQLPRIQAALLRAYPDPADRGGLIAEIWGEEEPDSAPLRSHVSGLRSVLARHGAGVEIQLVRGLGYRLVETRQ